MGEVLCNGFNAAVLIPSDRRDMTRICIVAIKDKKMGFIYIVGFTLSTSCHLA